MKYMVRTFAMLLMLTTFTYAVQPPPHLTDNVRFARLGEATGRLSEQRFLTTVTLVANAFGDITEAPRILVIHCDHYYGTYVGVQKGLGMALFTPNDLVAGGYELWIEGEGTDQKFVTAITNIYGKRLGKGSEEMEAVAKHVLAELNAVVDVHDLRQ